MAQIISSTSPVGIYLKFLKNSKNNWVLQSKFFTQLRPSSFSYLQKSYEYDIAALKMVELVDFQPNVIPICLPEGKDELIGRIGTVTGWGRRSEFGKISPILRKVNLPILSNEKCMEMYKISGKMQWIPSIFLCAGTENGGSDSCEGK